MPIAPGISAATLVNQPRAGRVLRTPVHDFQLRQRPFQLQPFMVAPVLPGDTLKNALVNYSALTDPIKNSLLGWWAEHWLFYVPFRAMPDSQHFQAMVLDPAFGELHADTDEPANTAYYHYHAADPSYVIQALTAVVEDWFRNEGETAADGLLDGVPQAGLMKKRWSSSMVLDSATAEPDTLPGQGDDDPNLDVIHGTGGATNFGGAYDAYQALVANQVLDITFEDWLRQYGVRMPRPQDDPKPEMLRYTKDWQFPGYVVDPTDGSQAAAVKWRGSLRADKDRKFKEPGVILGLSSFTPKVYYSTQKQVAIDSMKRSLDWLPAVLAEHAYTSMKLFTSDGAAAGNGPLGFTPSGDYWIDLRDLFVHGDQFVNFPLTDADKGFVALPGSDLKARFVSSADADALFSSASPANKIHQEGQARLSILSQVVDMTPNG